MGAIHGLWRVGDSREHRHQAQPVKPSQQGLRVASGVKAFHSQTIGQNDAVPLGQDGMIGHGSAAVHSAHSGQMRQSLGHAQNLGLAIVFANLRASQKHPVLRRKNQIVERLYKRFIFMERAFQFR